MAPEPLSFATGTSIPTGSTSPFQEAGGVSSSIALTQLISSLSLSYQICFRSSFHQALPPIPAFRNGLLCHPLSHFPHLVLHLSGHLSLSLVCSSVCSLVHFLFFPSQPPIFLTTSFPELTSSPAVSSATVSAHDIQN